MPEHFGPHYKPKRAFDSEADARAFIEASHRPLTTYRCGFCGAWHLATVGKSEHERASERAVTMALPACEPDHPPHTEWPTVNLIRGLCPNCGHYESDGVRAARVLRARRLIADRMARAP